MTEEKVSPQVFVMTASKSPADLFPLFISPIYSAVNLQWIYH